MKKTFSVALDDLIEAYLEAKAATKDEIMSELEIKRLMLREDQRKEDEGDHE